jgi:hypothetical protein
MDPTMIQHLGQVRLAELHRQAQRDALARAARRSRQRAHPHSALSQAGTRLSRLAAALAAGRRLTAP